MASSYTLPFLLGCTFCLGGVTATAAAWVYAQRVDDASAALPSQSGPASSADINAGESGRTVSDSTLDQGNRSGSTAEFGRYQRMLAENMGADANAVTESAQENLAAPQVVFVEDLEEPDLLDSVEQGESLSDALARLELQYQALAEKVAVEEERARLARATEEYRKRTEALTDQFASRSASTADLRDGTQLSDSPAQLRDSTTQPSVASSTPPAAPPVWTGAGPVEVNTVNNNTQNQQTNVVVVNQYSTVYWDNAPSQRPARPSQSTESRNNWAAAQQRSVMQPWTSNRDAYGGGARSPWDPIDMSKHHNPWGTSRLP